MLSTVYWKDENKEKEAGNGPFKKNWPVWLLQFYHLWTLSPFPFWKRNVPIEDQFPISELK